MNTNATTMHTMKPGTALASARRVGTGLGTSGCALAYAGSSVVAPNTGSAWPITGFQANFHPVRKDLIS